MPNTEFKKAPDTKGRNLPGSGKSLTPAERASLDQIEAGLRDQQASGLLSNSEASEALKDLIELENSEADENKINPIQEISDSNLGLSRPQSAADPRKNNPNNLASMIGGVQDKAKSAVSKPKAEDGSSKGGPFVMSSGDEKKSLKDILNSEYQEGLDNRKKKIDDLKDKKVGRFNFRGRAKKRVKVALLGMLLAAVAAVPIGIIGVIPHAIQGWIENRVSQYSQRAADKLGQRMLFAFFKDRVAIEKCKGAYSAAANASGLTPCRPRLEERDGRLSQLFNDWHAAKMEDKLVKHGIEVSYDPIEYSNGGKPYKIIIDGENFSASGDFNAPDWDISEFTGKRETSVLLKKQMKSVLKEDTKWWEYLKRRNLKAGYLRDLGLPRNFFLGSKAAKALDDVDAIKLKGSTKFRQYITQYVVSKGEGRLGLLLEILFSGESSKGSPSELRKNNKVIAAAADKLGVDVVERILKDYGGKSLADIQLQLMKNIISKFSVKLAEQLGKLAADAIPVIGWVLLALTIADMIDMATDGTLQHWISNQNSQAMLDVSNLMDTVVSEERRGFVDVASAGDMRLSLINGLSSSRVFTNTIGYKSPSGKKAGGYTCRPDINASDLSSSLGAIGEIFKGGDPTAVKQAGMSSEQSTCENHRVDYDPLNAFSDVFALAQVGLESYTSGCLGQGFDVPFCPSTQELYHGAGGGIMWLLNKLGLSAFTDFISSLPPIQWLMNNVIGWMTNGVAILITGQSLAGPELLQGGLKTDTKSGARIFDAWSGGQEALQFGFAKGGVDGGGLGGVPFSNAQASELNRSIASDRREEIASSSIFERFFDISHADTLVSSAIGVAVTEGGFSNFINPISNLSLAFGGISSSAFAASPEEQFCGESNKKGQAVTEFGVVCYGITDEQIDNLTDEQMQQYTDPVFCETHTAAIDSARKAAEDGVDLSKKDPDGTGSSTQIDWCRALGTTTDVMGTFARTDDTPYGFESVYEDVTPVDTGGSSEEPSENAQGKCDSGVVSNPNSGKPINDFEIQDVPGTNIKIRSSYCKNMLSLVKDALVDGVDFSSVSSSFRSYDKQVSLRRAHCGSSDFAIYEMSPSACRPPTARPGQSNHEKGLAIDFSGIGQCPSGTNPCRAPGNRAWEWLNSNASKYGLTQLNSEAWHWSIGGK